MTAYRRARSTAALLLATMLLALTLGSCGDGSSNGSTASVGTTSATSMLPEGDDVSVGVIVDGDTLRTTDGVRVRLLNIDTPEPTLHECWADEATEALNDLVPPGTPIRLVYDNERLDRYGRTLAHIYRASDGLWVNHQLALDGDAHPYVRRPNNSRYRPIRAAAEQARAEGRGLWAACEDE